MKKLLSILATTSCLAFIPFSSASAEETRKWYFTGGAAATTIPDVESDKDNYTVNSEVLSTSHELDLQDSKGYVLGIGYQYGDNTRFELNYSMQDTDVEGYLFNATYSGVTASVGTSATGTAEAKTYLLSVNRDFPSDNGWTPYVGAGIGRINIDVSDITVDLTELGDALEVDLGSTTYLSGDSNSVFLLQLRSGVAKEITDRTSLYGEINWNRSGGWTAGSGATAIKWQGLNMFGYGMGFRYKL